MSVRAGELQHKITLFSVTQGVDSNGIPTKTLVSQGATHAAAFPVSGKEQFLSGRDVLKEMYKFKIRYWKDLKTTWVIQALGRYWDIQMVEPLGRHNREFMMIHCDLWDSAGVTEAS